MNKPQMNFEIKPSDPMFCIHDDAWYSRTFKSTTERRSKGPSNHKSKSKTAHKRKAEKKARKIMRRGTR